MALTYASDLTVLENRFAWNRPFGFAVFGKGQTQDSNVELTRNAADDNGIGGEYMADVRVFTVTQEELLRNNWAGRRAGVKGHATTGAKYSKLANGAFHEVVASDNHGHGLWFDWENQAVSVLDCFASGNTGNGIYFEANDNWPPPAVADPTSEVKYSQLIGNDVGVKGISSSAVVLSENIFIDNHSSAISLDGTPRGQGSATKYLRDWTIQENYVAGSCAHHLWLSANDSLGKTVYTEWQPFMESMDSDDNDYSHIQGAGFAGFWIKQEYLTLQEWQTCGPQPWCFLTQDANSTFIP